MNLSFLAAARERPEAVALLSEGKRFAHESLLPRVNGRIAALRRAGIAPDRPAALEGAPEPGTILTLWALLEMGVPALLTHPGWTDGERRRALEEASPVRVLGPLPEEAGGPFPGGPPLPDDERTAAILFTSGATGRPKGVLLSRRAFAAAAAGSAALLGAEESDRWGLCLPLAGVGGLSVVTRSLCLRRAVALAAPFDPERLIRAVERDRITLLSLVPTQMVRLLDRDPPWRPPAHLRAILLGGGPAETSLLERCARAGAPVLPSWGMTETCAQAATARPEGIPHREAAAPPLPGVEIRAREERVEVRGPTLFSGYLGEAGRASPFDRAGWFDTGDRGRIDGKGRLHVTGRREEILISGGENVAAPEVEEALRELPEVEEAVVFGVPDRTWGDRVAAALVLREGAILPAEEIRAHAARRLAPHKRPRLLALLPAAPRAASGKIDRAAAVRAARPRLRPL